MSTGKQLAFMSGEISPAMRFNSREISYATGLSKLKNGYVRKEGGVSNRQGFKMLPARPVEQTYPPYIPISGIQKDSIGINPNEPSITMFSFWNSVANSWDILELCLKPLPSQSLVPYSTGEVLHYRMNMSGEDFFPVTIDYVGAPFEDVINFIRLPRGIKLSELKIVVIDKYLLILPWLSWQEWELESPSVNYELKKYASINVAYSLDRSSFEVFGRAGDQARPVYNPSGSVFKGLSSGPPAFPARNLITIEDDEGLEIPVFITPTAITDITTWNPGTPTVTEIWYSASNVSATWKARMTFPFNVSEEKAKSYVARMYKTSWTNSGYETISYALVGTASPIKVPATINDYEVQFQDYGASDPTTKPAIVKYLNNSPEDIIPSFGQQWDFLGNATSACFFQQRLHVFVEKVSLPQQESPLGLGTVFYPAKVPIRGEQEYLCSKLNAPKQLNQPISYSKQSEPFIYKIRGMRGEKPLFSLSSERVVHFTSGGVYVTMGDQAGNVSFLTVNPEKISDVGCSPRVEPKIVGDSIYYISLDGRRLFRLQWAGSQQGYKPSEVSRFSSHLLENETVMRMEGTSNREDTVHLVTSSGKLIHVTITAEGYGWSRSEILEGRIENICTLKVKPNFSKDFDVFDDKASYQEVLCAYVIRNDIRTIEYLDVREDSGKWENQVFIDSAIWLGTSLTLKEDYYWPSTMPQQGYFNSFAPVKGIEGVTPLSNPAMNSSNTDTPSFSDRNILPQFFLNFGDATTSSWDEGDTIPIYAEDSLNPGGVIAGIDFNDPDNFRVDISYEKEWQDENREIKKTLVKAQLKVLLSSEEDSSLYAGFTKKYLAEIVEGSVPEDLRDVFNTSLDALLKRQRWTNWKYAYKTFVAKALATPNAPLVTLYYNSPSSLRDEEGSVKLSIVTGHRILRSALNPEDELRAQASKLIKEDYLDGGNTYQRVRLEMDEFITGAWVGIPYEFEMQTLPIEASDNRTLLTGKTLVNAVGLGLHNSMGGFIGMPNAKLEDMAPMESMKYSTPNFFAQTPNAFSGYIEYSIPAEWNDGTVTIKHVDPTPLTVAAIFPRGESSARG